MSRLATATALLSVAALAAPGTVHAAPLDASAHLEVHATADSASAVRHVHGGANRVKRLIARSESSLQQAYAVTVAHGLQASDGGAEASASFSAATQQQGTDLAIVVHRSDGALKATAVHALSRTAALEARVVQRLASQLAQQQGDVSAQQGESVAAVGDGQASLTTTIVLTASSDGISRSLQSHLDRTTAAALIAQARLAEVVADVRDRAEGAGHDAMAATEASLRQDGSATADAIRRGGRADVSFSVDSGNVTLGQLANRGIDTGDSPADVSASGDAHVDLGQEGRR